MNSMNYMTYTSPSDATLWNQCLCSERSEGGYVSVCTHVHVRTHQTIMRIHCTGWRRLIGSLKLQILFHKRATKYRALLRKLTYKDKGSYESSPPCMNHMNSMKYLTYTLQHTATHCNTLHHTAPRRNNEFNEISDVHTATHCNTLQHTATHCTTLQQWIQWNIWRTHCNTLQHTATHCNTLQLTATMNSMIYLTYTSPSNAMKSVPM